MPRVAPVSPDVPERDHRVQHAVALVRQSASADRDQVQMSFSNPEQHRDTVIDFAFLPVFLPGWTSHKYILF